MKRNTGVGVRKGGMLAAALLLLGGCASSTHYCSPGDAARGYVCYDGINFGRSTDPLYRQGVRDGCETGKGYFTKDYRLSGSSESYRQGWFKGREVCRPPGWKEYDPREHRGGDASARSGRRHHASAVTEDPVVEAIPERLQQSRYADESPEILSYD
ncbi:hypothetical protein [Nitratifractor sp.]